MFALKFYQASNNPEEPTDPEQPTVEGLAVEASPKSGASVEAGQKITLTSAEGTQIYYTMATNGTEPADPQVSEEQQYTEPVTIEATPEKDKPVIIKAMAYKAAAKSR